MFRVDTLRTPTKGCGRLALQSTGEGGAEGSAALAASAMTLLSMPGPDTVRYGSYTPAWVTSVLVKLMGSGQHGIWHCSCSERRPLRIPAGAFL